MTAIVDRATRDAAVREIKVKELTASVLRHLAAALSENATQADMQIQADALAEVTKVVNAALNMKAH